LSRLAQKKRCRQKSVEAVREEEVKLRGVTLTLLRSLQMALRSYQKKWRKIKSSEQHKTV